MFTDGPGTQQRVTRLIRDWIRPATVAARVPVEITAWDVPGEPVPFREAVAQNYRPAREGEPWSKAWGTTWFRVRGTVPQHWGKTDAHRTELIVDLGFSTAQAGFQAEGTVYRADGSVVKGLEPRNHYVPVEAQAGERFEFFVEAASNPEIMAVDWVTPTHLGSKATAGTDPIYVLRTLELQRIDVESEALVLDLEVLNGLVPVLPEGSPRASRILRALESALDAVDPDDVAGSATAARAALAPALASPSNASATTVHAVGHAHIDSAWLWPIRETIRKCARTFSNALHLMDIDPDFVFAASSAQHYDWMRRLYPDIYATIKQRVAEGRWIIIGGQWIESDPYMIGGEAFIRQFLEGQRFFREEFGQIANAIWLPDSFGYSGALPGIAKHVGMEWMLTQKLSWNETNSFPHHSFRWEGIDGSEIFTHFPPVDTYNSMLTAAELQKAEDHFRENGAATVTLVPFGYGDGGGGPTRELLGVAHRESDLEGSPRVILSTPEAFFSEAASQYEDAPVWVGELYLENHRGVLTSQHRTKRGNRRSEHLLREAELWASTAAIRVGSAYPFDELSELWQGVLLNQFHDILPGSSIAWVHREAEEAYADIEDRAQKIIAAALSDLAGTGNLSLLANPSAYAAGSAAAGSIVQTQENASAESVIIESNSDGWLINNGTVKLRVGRDGLVVSLIDLHAGRELVPAGEALGALHLYRDIPNDWDAWNLDRDYRRHDRIIDDVQSIDVSVDAVGAAVVTTTRADGKSTYTQVMSLAPGSSTLEFTTSADWRERRKLLKLEFPVNIHTSHAQSEIQFGHLTRPIHANTSWDWARFETVALRWVRVAEAEYGVTVANDETYGHSFFRDRTDEGPFVRIGESLLRSPMAPDPDADQGEHSMRTTLTVGSDVRSSIEEGYRLNTPVREILGEREVAPLVVVTDGSAVVESIKLADDRSGDVIVRLYESQGGRTTAALTIGGTVTVASLVDGLERALPATDALALTGADLTLELKPFEIASIRLAVTATP